MRERIIIKGPGVIAKMREAGRRLAHVHTILKHSIKPGVSTGKLNRIAETAIRKLGCVPNFLHYEGFPAASCISVNDVVVHGIPSDEIILKEGDIVGIDLGLIYRGYHSDAARTYGVGNISRENRLLIERTRQSFFEGIKYARAGNHLHQISNAVADYAESFGYGVVYDLMGHGIGKSLHEMPEIPNCRMKRRGPKLREGMTLAVEPMINIGEPEVFWDMYDGWTVRTEDGSNSAHYENTILITDGDPEILTLMKEESEECQKRT